MTAWPSAAGIQVTLCGDNALDARGLAGFCDDDGVALRHRAGRDRPAIAAEVAVRPVNILHGEPKRPQGRIVIDLHRFKMMQQRWTFVPRHFVGSPGNVLAIACRHRDWHDAGEAEVGSEFAILRGDPLKGLAAEIDQIDLVDREGDVADSEQRGDEGMTPCLLQHTLLRIDQDDRDIGGRGAGRHIARILLMTRRVGDDELALRCGKKAVCDIDRDALFALRLQAIDQQRKVDVVTGRAVLLRIACYCGKLVLEDQLGIVEEPADQRGFAVINRAAGEKPQQRLVFLCCQESAHICGCMIAQVAIGLFKDVAHGDQKYPSRFLRSIEPASSRSMRRPWRSEVRATSISPTIASRLSASESIAPVSG